MGASLDPLDAHLSGSEFGLDGVAIVVQGRLVKDTDDVEEAIEDIRSPAIDFYFFQTKTGTSFDYGDMSRFFDSIAGFFSGEMTGESHQLDDLMKAKDLLYEKGVGRRNPGVHAYYVCTGNYEKPQRLEALIGTTKQQLSDLNIFDSDRINIQMVGARELQRLYRAASSAVEVQIDFPRNVVLPAHGSVEEAYIGYLTADQIIKLVSLEGEEGQEPEINKAVFFDNIRDFDPDSKINGDISATLQAGQGSDFIFRNNGITVVAKAIDRTGDRFRIEDYQVVNGCQTSNIIFNNKEHTAGVHIPFRLIGTKDDSFISSIIAGTNRQNPVREEQFWALRPFMKNFEEYCASLPDEQKIYFERRENQFRGQRVEKARIVQPSTLMKSVAATLLHQPHRSARDYRGISAEYQDRLFQEDHDVRVYHAACYTNYRLDFLWRNQRLDNALKIYRFYILSTIGRKLSNGRDIFGMKKSEIERFAAALVALSDNESKLKDAAERVSSAVEGRLSSLKVESRERRRDIIRSESFSTGMEDSFRDLELRL